MCDLGDRVALVTGASRGIGRGVAMALAAAGADVAVNYHVQRDGAEKVCEAIRACGRRAAAVQADVADEIQVGRLVEAVEEALGPVEILVNNAGVAVPAKVGAVSLAQFDETIRVNLRSTFLVTEAVLPAMRRASWGRLITISSVAARTGGKVGADYTASKAGQLGLTRYYAAALAGEGITANAIAPALIDTDMVAPLRHLAPELLPVGRLGTVDEVARIAVMLAGNAFITGQTIDVNGGLFAG